MFEKPVPEYTDIKEAPMLWYYYSLVCGIVYFMGAVYAAFEILREDASFFVMVAVAGALWYAVWSWFFWKKHWWTVCILFIRDIWDVLCCVCSFILLIAAGEDWGLMVFRLAYLLFYAYAEWVYFTKRRLLFKPADSALSVRQREEGETAPNESPAPCGQEPLQTGEEADPLPAEALPAVRFCRYCGEGIAPNERFCRHCGKRLLAD